MPLTKIGTCAWCGKHNTRLIFTATVVDGRFCGDYVCEKCREVIRRYMRDTGSITPWEAMKEFGCMRLGARIYDLKRRGVAVRREMVSDRNRYGKRVQYARYSVAAE